MITQWFCLIFVYLSKFPTKGAINICPFLICLCFIHFIIINSPFSASLSWYSIFSWLKALCFYSLSHWPSISPRQYFRLRFAHKSEQQFISPIIVDLWPSLNISIRIILFPFLSAICDHVFGQKYQHKFFPPNEAWKCLLFIASHLDYFIMYAL